jgi:hypothetical protein
MYQIKETTTQATLNITKQQHKAPSLHWVVIFRSSTACVEHRLGKLVSRRGVEL